MPSFRDLLNYLRHTGWEESRDGDHYYFRKYLADGTILKTKVSHALAKEIPPALFARILKHQLRTSKEEFNRNK